MSQNFYNYCIKDEKEAELMLAKLIGVEKLLPQDKILAEIFAYARDIKAIVFAPEEAGTVIHTQVLGRFIDNNLLNSFLAKPKDEEIKKQVAHQLLLIYAATGGPLAEAVLTPEELLKVTVGAEQNYNGVLLARTFGKILTGELNFQAYQEGIWMLLPFNSADFIGQDLDWETALFIFLAVQILWQNFELLEERTQAWFLSQYTYLAVAGKVDINFILDNYVQAGKAGADQQERIDLVGGALVSSEEKIPANTSLRDWKKLKEVIDAYTLSFLPGNPDGYKQEEFLKTLYKGESGGELYRAWLRPILQILFYLNEWQSKNLV